MYINDITDNHYYMIIINLLVSFIRYFKNCKKLFFSRNFTISYTASSQDVY